MKTLQDFLEVCKTLRSDEIYDVLFPEDEIREAVYDEAIRLGLGPLEDLNEPMRASLIKLGEHYNIQSLIDY